jgi:hypothetical protein
VVVVVLLLVPDILTRDKISMYNIKYDLPPYPAIACKSGACVFLKSNRRRQSTNLPSIAASWIAVPRPELAEQSKNHHLKRAFHSDPPAGTEW